MPETETIDLGFVHPQGGYDRIERRPGQTRYFLKGTLHRLDGPAWTMVSGEQIWFDRGRRHRVDGPEAILKRTNFDGADVTNRPQWVAEWKIDRKLHRVDGPAVIWEDGSTEWWQFGFRGRIGGPCSDMADGSRAWIERDLNVGRHHLGANLPRVPYHRLDGPALIYANGTRHWIQDGVLGKVDGPMMEWPTGRMMIMQGGESETVEASDPRAVAIRKAQLMRSREEFYYDHGGSIGKLSFYDDPEATEEFWANANTEARATYSRWALKAWTRARDNLAYDFQDQINSWLERFTHEAAEGRRRSQLLVNDMDGHLLVALDRLETRPLACRDVGFDGHGLDAVVAELGLPLSDVVADVLPESKLLRIVATIPDVASAVPEYIALDTWTVGRPKARKPRTKLARSRLYVSGISEVSLACLAAIVACPNLEWIDTIVLNIMVDSVDSATGLDRRHCVLSIQVNTENYRKLNLRRVDSIECVKSLNGVVPRQSAELSPVRPLVEFDKFDKRIVEAADVVGALDNRANLMDLTPNDFEALIQNLFSKIGLDTHQTQSSRDGGVDCIAYDSRPIFGGKIIIQAKRYKNTVGVSAVRDLYGTVMNEGASKGILITTSGYGKASYDFANGKPLELLGGSHLLHLLKEHTGVDARIVFPEAWEDLPLHSEDAVEVIPDEPSVPSQVVTNA